MAICGGTLTKFDATGAAGKTNGAMDCATDCSMFRPRLTLGGDCDKLPSEGKDPVDEVVDEEGDEEDDEVDMDVTVVADVTEEDDGETGTGAVSSFS